MAGTIPAMRQLLEQVAARNPDVDYELSDVDGFDRYRSVTFDEATAEWLIPALRVIEDPRIADTVDRKVTFVGDVRADFAQPFPIEDVADILSEPEPEEKPEEKPAPRKRAAKAQ